MSDHTFDAFTRRAVDAISRRRSLLTLGGAALVAGPVSPVVSKAKKGGNKNKAKCQKQVGKCREGLTDLCAVVFGAENVEECVELFGPCCEFLKGCNTAQALACATEVARTIKT